MNNFVLHATQTASNHATNLQLKGAGLSHLSLGYIKVFVYGLADFDVIFLLQKLLKMLIV